MNTAFDVPPWRVWLEHGCRTLAVAALLFAAWLAVRDGKPSAPTSASAGVQRLSVTTAMLSADSTTAVMSRLRDVVVAPIGDAPPDTVGVVLPALPVPTIRSALAVLPSAGIPVQWFDSTNARGVALSIAPVSGPRGGYLLRTSNGPSTLPLILRDRGGLLDSVAVDRLANGTTATWRMASLSPPVEAHVGSSTATAIVPDSTSTKRLMVIAQPGWESKFAVAALEELGWRVDGSLRIAPTGAVRVGAPERLDTSRYAAVVVLDSMAVDAVALTRFVQRGGGLVVAGDALRIPALAALRPARATSVRGALAGALLTEAPRRGLEAWELDLVPGATILQADAGEGTGAHAHAEPAVVVRRVGAGRVAAAAYRDTWRWRMEGTDDGAADHRAWWGTVISAVIPDVVPAPFQAGDRWPGDAAPYADLVARLGAPSASPSANTVNALPRSPWRPSAVLLFGIAASALLVEWASRRLRGLR